MQDTRAPCFTGPIWTLLVLAPVTAELVNGSTRLSVLFVLAPEIMVWGVGALVSRELVRRWRAGWVSLLLLGLALSIAEEFLIQQTSLAPIPFPSAQASYGRWLGINWIYFLFMLGYEATFAVLIPVTLSELIWAPALGPDESAGPWLSKRGWIACGVFFAAGWFLAWYSWVIVARPRLGAAPYHAPAGLLIAGAAAIVALIAMAWAMCGVKQLASGRRPWPWVVFAVAAIATTVWVFVLAQIFVPRPVLTARQALLTELTVAVMIFALFLRWTRSAQWTAMHSWSACFGAVLSLAAVSSLSNVGYTAADFAFKNGVDVAVIAGLVWLGLRLTRRAKLAPTGAPQHAWLSRTSKGA